MTKYDKYQNIPEVAERKKTGVKKRLDNSEEMIILKKFAIKRGCGTS